jgi:hypothetical protein
MRFMVIVHLSKETEAAPAMEDLAPMGAFNERLAKAGVLLDADGLKPSSRGTRITFDGEKRTVTDGPFAETKELISGYWIVEMKSRDEVVEWFRQAPLFDNGDTLEIREFWEAEDFADAAQVREQEARIRTAATEGRG